MSEEKATILTESGLKKLEDIPTDTYSGNMRSRFIAAGFKALTGSKYLSGPNYLLPGDVLLYENHHAAVNITYGKYADRTGSAPKPAEPAKLGDRILKNGMSGADVKELQLALIKCSAQAQQVYWLILCNYL